MAKGAIAKAAVEDKLRAAFGKDFIGVDPSAKKIYIQAEEDGEMVQVAITMTCPKTPFTVENSVDAFPEGNFVKPSEYKPAEVTEGELDNIRKMIKELGL